VEAKVQEQLLTRGEVWMSRTQGRTHGARVGRDAPDKSPVFSKYPKFLKDRHALHFIRDTIRLASGGGVEACDVDLMMDMDTHHHESGIVVAALSTVAVTLAVYTLEVPFYF
jgi:hypothetical protein